MGGSDVSYRFKGFNREDDFLAANTLATEIVRR
jgi:hypothetical protein